MSENMRKERDQLIYQSREQGMTFSSIGKQWNITAGRARDICLREQQILRDKNKWWNGLSIRIVQALSNNGIKSREKALEAYQSGLLRPKKFPRNYGWKSHRELAEWLGLPEPKKEKRVRYEFCPHCHAKLM